MPVAEFAELRRTAPIWWNEQPALAPIFGDEGFWVVSKHADVRDISKDSGLWSTNAKGAIIRLPEYMEPDQLEFTKALLINHDPPEHSAAQDRVADVHPARGPRPGGDTRCNGPPGRRGRPSPTAVATSSTTSRSTCR